MIIVLLIAKTKLPSLNVFHLTFLLNAFKMRAWHNSVYCCAFDALHLVLLDLEAFINAFLQLSCLWLMQLVEMKFRF